MHLYVSLDFYDFQSVFFATMCHVCILYIGVFLSVVLVREIYVFIYWECYLILFQVAIIYIFIMAVPFKILILYVILPNVHTSRCQISL